MKLEELLEPVGLRVGNILLQEFLWNGHSLVVVGHLLGIPDSRPVVSPAKNTCVPDDREDFFHPEALKVPQVSSDNPEQ